MIPFGDMNSWVVRTVKDSKIIGGNTHTLYEIAGNATLPLNTPYKNRDNSPWGTSNVMADVGVTKGSSSVFREKRNDGYCARLETRLEKVRVLGLFNINVMAAGSIYLGEMGEPIKSVSSAIPNMNKGVPVSGSPKKVIFDYKCHTEAQRYYANGMGEPKKVEGPNVAEVVVILQRRWEDSEGKIFARRVGTGNIRLGDTAGEWKNNYVLEIMYGDITKKPFYKPHMGLLTDKTAEDDRHYARNSKGEMVNVSEVGWGLPNEVPTHIYIIFSSSQNGAFVGAPGSMLWVDNVKLGY